MSAIRPTVRALRMPMSRRLQSTSTPSGAADKAIAGLSKAVNAAGPMVSGTVKALGKAGGRTGQAVAIIEKAIPQVTYYSKVGLELGKFVAKGRNMELPTMVTFQSYYLQAFNALKQPAKLVASAQQSLIALRSGGITKAQAVTAGVLLAELLGFFTVGEIIGRFKLIGYRGEVASAHH
ncbi:ATP synthase subunit g, mitochondrial [Ceratocystis fimbriata CBS 114723]|uniref:ATP synthase subunit g, mitochondrial n=1 Tax=Ceratocystis fimbriata CBS 114723 TaxID=1035309 RepID=A0A2C5X9S3_9PEZI|nr:ATP synthase subunit g, mitochondrial [Ceratocystis fimbriata CBS 114723]